MLSFLRSLPVRSSPSWTPSEFGDLPALSVPASQQERDNLLLAGGLALLLSRCTPRITQRDFPNTLRAYKFLRVQLAAGQPVVLNARMLAELLHEIAGVADAATREAARRCFQRSLRANAA